jgi:hypothetical protein
MAEFKAPYIKSTLGSIVSSMFRQLAPVRVRIK